jgi:hypothetical protein
MRHEAWKSGPGGVVAREQVTARNSAVSVLFRITIGAKDCFLEWQVHGRQPLLVEAAHSEAEQVIARIHMRVVSMMAQRDEWQYATHSTTTAAATETRSGVVANQR